jgi:NADH-quinone oxidoreductase subunit D
MELLARISGNRVNYAMNTFGGVRRDLTPDLCAEILAAVDILEERTKYYIGVVMEEVTLIQRLSGVGYLSHEDAVARGAVGPTGRASEIASDTRKDDPYAAYPYLDFHTVTDNHCDVYGRALVRVGELMQTYKILRQLVQELPDGPIVVKAPRKIPAGEALSRYEAPRGEDVYYVKANGTDKPERVKVRAPTLANLASVAKMMENNYLADVPIILAAIDPCFSCTDRMIETLNMDSRAGRLTDFRQLRQFSINWYKKRGLDFTALNKKLILKQDS